MQLSGDPAGGAVAQVVSDGDGHTKLVAFSATGASSELGPVNYRAGFAIHPNGVVYAVQGNQLVGFDIGFGGATPISLGTYSGNGTPTITEDGRVLMMYSTFDSVGFDVSGQARWCHGTAEVLFASEDGSTSRRTLADTRGWAEDPTVEYGCPVADYKLIQNRLGGYVAWNHDWVQVLDADFAYVGGILVHTISNPGPGLNDVIVLDDYTMLATTNNAIYRLGENGYELAASSSTYATRATSLFAVDGGGAVISHADGTVEGPNSAFADIHLSPIQYVGDGKYLGEAGAGVFKSVVGPVVTQNNSRWPAPLGNGGNAVALFFSNLNQIEILTSATSEEVFDRFLTTFSGVNGGNVASVRQGSDEPNVTGVRQILTFTLSLPLGALQPPFSVVTVRVDRAARTIVAATMYGHPLIGWRYWRVFEPVSGDLVVETGSLEIPYPFGVDPFEKVVGFFAEKWLVGKQLEIWKQELEFILNELRRTDESATQGSALDPSLVAGKWNRNYKPYVIQNICGPVPSSVAPFCR